MATTDLIDGIVRILDIDGEVVGTGFVVSDDGLIATCAHVVASVPAGAGDLVTVHFQAGDQRLSARVVEEWWRDVENEDVAILQVEDDLPEGVRSLKLGESSATNDHKVRTFGFPEVGSVEGIWGKGEIVGTVTEDGHVWIQLRSSEITSGFSGGPVYDEARRRVIGMVVTIAENDTYSRLQETAFVISSEMLQNICSVLKVEDICPYRGLLPFMEGDADFFFGRKVLIGELVDQLRRNPHFLAVVGSSGSGKSSVIRAGLMPKIGRGEVPGFERTTIATFRPGVDSIDSLKQSLQNIGIFDEKDGIWGSIRSHLERNLDNRLVIFVDQFEELFALSSEEIRTEFLAGISDLLKSPLSLTLIITIRADFYDSLLTTLLGEDLCTGQFNVRPLSEEELREAIMMPAEVVGLEVEAGLADMIAKDLKSTKNCLPLLQFALTQLWAHRKDGTLTYEGYRRIGGATGSIGLWAAETYNRLSKREKELSRRIFTRLVHYGDGDSPDTRRSSQLSDLVAGEDEQFVIGLVNEFVDSRLLVTDRNLDTGAETVEIVHDSLLREWPQLREWIRDQRIFLLWRQGLDEKLEDWRIRDDDEGNLLRGSSLVEAESWLEKKEADLNPAERKYIQASSELYKRMITERERRRRQIITGLVIFTSIALILTTTVFVKSDEAKQNKNEALVLDLAYQSEAIIRNNNLKNLDRSILFGIESLKRSYKIAGEQALRRGLRFLLHPIALLNHDDSVQDLEFSPDGRLLATVSLDNTSCIWDAATGDQLITMKHDDSVRDLEFSPDGKLLATASRDKSARIWRVDSGEEFRRIDHPSSVQVVEFSPDGKLLMTVAEDNTVRILDVKTSEELELLIHDDFVWVAEFSPDGTLLATASNDEVVRIWDVGTGELIKKKDQHSSASDVKFSPDGTLLATANSDNTARLWNISNEKELQMNHSGAVYDLAFSPDGKLLATASDKAYVWDVSTGVQLRKINCDGLVWDVEFSPDGKLLATASEGKSVLILDTDKWDECAKAYHSSSVMMVAFSPNGKRLATTSGNNARIWDTTIGDELMRLDHGEAVWDVEFSPDGRLLATASLDNTSCIWDAATGDQLEEVNHNDAIWDVEFSPDGKLLATASDDKTARIWRVDNGKELRRMNHSDTVWDVEFSPNGKLLATASRDGTACIWCVDTGKRHREMTHDDNVWDVEFSLDGKLLATASDDKTACIWRLDGDGKPIKMEHFRPVYDIMFSPDGKLLATASWDLTTGLWNTSTGKKVDSIEHEGYVYAVKFSPDGKYLATASSDNSVRIWNSDAKEDPIVRHHDGDVVDLEFSPDGMLLATASTDKTARIWRINTLKEIGRMNHEGSVKRVAFSPDGKYLATASDDRAARVWLYREEDLIEEARNCLTRNLDEEEWEEYIGNEIPYHKTFEDKPGLSETGNLIKVGVIEVQAIDAYYRNYMITGTIDGARLAFYESNLSNVVPIYEYIESESVESVIQTVINLIHVDDVQVIVAGINSEKVLAVAPIASENGVVLICSAATSPKLSKKGDRVFRTIPSDKEQGAFAADFIFSKGYERIALVYVNSEYGTGLANIFAQNFEDLGGEIAGKVAIEPRAAGLSPEELTRIKDANPEIIYIVSSYPSSTVAILQQIEDMDIDADLFGSEALKIPQLLNLGDPAEGMMFTSLTSGSEEFQEKYRDRYEMEPPLYAAQGYDAAMSILEAIKGGATTKEEINESLCEVGFYFGGATGRVKFDEYGDVKGRYEIIEVKKGRFITSDEFSSPVRIKAKIDRIEDYFGIASIQDGKSTKMGIHLPQEYIPQGCIEGDVLEIKISKK